MKRPETIEHDGRDWVEIKQAARYARFKAVLIEEQGRSGAFELLDLDGLTYVPLSAANKLKRETAAMRSIERQNRVERQRGLKFGHKGFRSAAPVSPNVQVQEVLPMSSGREGQGWLGQRKRD
jgi:hypothetical protein